MKNLLKKYITVFLLLLTCRAYPQEKKFIEIKAAMERYFANEKANITKLDSKEEDGEEDGAFARYKRWEWWAERHLDVNGYVVNDIEKGWQKYQQQKNITSRSSPLSIGGTWQELDNNFSTSVEQMGKGRINCVVEVPGTYHILVGTAGGGIWRGEKYPNLPYLWFPLSDGLPNLSITDICVNPLNTAEIFISTGNGDDNIALPATGYSSSGSYSLSIGILKSEDGGANWQKTSVVFFSRPGRLIYRMIMDPNNPGTMFAATNNGIYRTADGWKTFATTASAGLAVFDIKLQPGSSQILFAATSTNVYKSVNGGVNFSTVFAFPTTVLNLFPIPVNFTPQRLCLGVTPANSEYLYVLGGANNIGYMGLYRCTNSGAAIPAFVLQSNSPDLLSYNTSGMGGPNSQVFYDIVIAVHPQNAERVFIGGLNLWESASGGSSGSWVVRSDWTSNADDPTHCHSDFHQIKFSNLNSNLLFNSNDGGLFTYDLSVDRWSYQSKPLNCTQYYRIAVGNQTAGDYKGRLIIGGTQDNGTLQWRTDGLKKVYGGDGMDNAFASADGENVICTYARGDIKVSSNGGNSFGSPLNDPEENGAGAWVTPIVQHCSLPNLVYIGYKNIYSNYNAAFSWANWATVIATNFPNPIVAMCQGNYFTYGQPSTNVIYCAVDMATAGAANYHIWRIENDIAGSRTDLGAVPNIVTGIKCDPNDARYVYYTLGGVGNNNKVFYSANRGQTFTNISGALNTVGALPDVAINCIALKGGGHSGIYVGTDIGVYHRFSWASGQTWTLFSNMLPNVPVTDLEVVETANEIYAATYGRGLWKSDLYQQCQPTLSVAGATTGITYYEASQSLYTSTYTRGGIGSKVVFNSGAEIILSDGFAIEEGSGMWAYIQGCSNPRVDSLFFKPTKQQSSSTKIPPQKKKLTNNKVTEARREKLPVKISIYQ